MSPCACAGAVVRRFARRPSWARVTLGASWFAFACLTLTSVGATICQLSPIAPAALALAVFFFSRWFLWRAERNGFVEIDDAARRLVARRALQLRVVELDQIVSVRREGDLVSIATADGNTVVLDVLEDAPGLLEEIQRVRGANQSPESD